jgi:DNA primase
LTQEINKLIIEAYVNKVSVEIFRNNQMQTIAKHFSQFSSQAKQVAMPTYWCAKQSGSNDRTPEIRSGFHEGSGYA